jgi:hypothetical protein
MTVPVPMTELPSRNVTRPLPAWLLPCATAAVKVTLDPYTAVSDDTVNAVVVVSGDTDTMTGAEAEGDKVDVPRKLAVIEFAPTGSVVRFNIATPLMVSPVPMVEPPLKNVTAPLVTGMLPFAATAVMITLDPNAGLVEDALNVVVV